MIPLLSDLGVEFFRELRRDGDNSGIDRGPVTSAGCFAAPMGC